MKITTGLIPLFLITLFTPLAPQAQIPDSINFQAYLTDNAGAPIDQPTSILFSLYASETGGTPGWSETLLVDVDQGLVSVELGAGAVPLPEELFSTPLWLGLTVGADSEMAPRRALTATGFAFRAGDAFKLDGNTVEDVLAFAGGGSIRPGAPMALLELRLDSQTINLTGLDLTLDGSSFNVGYFQSQSQSVWAPLVLDYTYPHGMPSPLGLVAGSAMLFNSVEMILADDMGFAVRISGASVITQEITSTVIDDAGARGGMGGGSQTVHETVALQGDFIFPELTGPNNSGSLRVDISLPGTSNTFFAKGRGPLTVAVEPSGPGQGNPLPIPVPLLGLGPAELGLILMNYAVSEEVNLALWLSGTRLPVGRDCRLASLQGLSPVVIDDGGGPVASVQVEEVVFNCLSVVPP